MFATGIFPRDTRRGASSDLPVRSGSGRVCCAFLLVILSLGAIETSAQVRTWELTDRPLIERTTTLLERYYSLTRPDTLRLRYVRTWGDRLVYRLRGRLAGSDSITALLSISIGQLTIFPTDNIRIALGDDLYGALLASGSRADVGIDELIPADELAVHGVSLSLDQLRVRVVDNVIATARIGAPESNLDWWTDGTFRLGIETGEWECAILLPFAAGRTQVGPLRERQILPSMGVSGRVRRGSLEAALRISRQEKFISVDSGRFVHTLSGFLSYGSSVPMDFGVIEWRLGGGVEEFRPCVPDSVRPSSDDITLRLTPHIAVTIANYTGILRAGLSTRDGAISLTGSVRLTSNLWIDLRCVATDMLRDASTFEHPFHLFLTPRVVF